MRHKPKPQKVWVTVIHHRHGVDVQVSSGTVQCKLADGTVRGMQPWDVEI